MLCLSTHLDASSCVIDVPPVLRGQGGARLAMPIHPDARVAITLRLRTACTGTHESCARKPARIEIIGDVALAQHRLTIGATCSGIEQTLKFLLALDKALTVGELLAPNGIVENPGQEPGRRTRYRIHELGTFFSRLDGQTRESVENAGRQPALTRPTPGRRTLRTRRPQNLRATRTGPPRHARTPRARRTHRRSVRAP